jgi:Glycosyl hydrolase family 47
MKFGMRSNMPGRVTRVLHILMMSCCRYLGIHLTSCVLLLSFLSFLSIEVSFFTKRFSGWSVTLFDSLSTMWIMGLREEFDEAVDSIRDIQFNITKVNHTPLNYH